MSLTNYDLVHIAFCYWYIIHVFFLRFQIALHPCGSNTTDIQLIPFLESVWRLSAITYFSQWRNYINSSYDVQRWKKTGKQKSMIMTLLRNIASIPWLVTDQYLCLCTSLSLSAKTIRNYLKQLIFLAITYFC